MLCHSPGSHQTRTVSYGKILLRSFTIVGAAKTRVRSDSRASIDRRRHLTLKSALPKLKHREATGDLAHVQHQLDVNSAEQNEPTP